MKILMALIALLGAGAVPGQDVPSYTATVKIDDV